jgi:hypothetical protein
MAENPNKVVVQVDMRGADEAVKQMFRQMARAGQLLPPRRRPLWRRIARRLKGRR